MQAVLVMFRSDGERRSFSITRDMTVIGRREDCDLRIPLGEVSRKHCRLVREEDTIRVEDLGSSNGTYHNGHRVEKEANLSAGDSIQVGPVVFVLQLDGVPADEDVHPVTSDAAAMGYDPSHAVDHAPPAPPGQEHSTEDLEPLDDVEPLPPGGEVEVIAGSGVEELEPLPLEEAHSDEPLALDALEPLPEGEDLQLHDDSPIELLDDDDDKKAGH